MISFIFIKVDSVKPTHDKKWRSKAAPNLSTATIKREKQKGIHYKTVIPSMSRILGL